jgi:hypothetical protein
LNSELIFSRAPAQCRLEKCLVIVVVVGDIVVVVVADIVPVVDIVVVVAVVLDLLDGERVCGGDELRLQRQTGCTTNPLRTYFKSIKMVSVIVVVIDSLF